MIVLAFLLLFLVWVPLVFMWNGFVLGSLWLWFIVPHFGVQPLAMTTAIGIILVVSLLTYRRAGGDKTKEEWWYALLYPFYIPGLLYIFGSAVHLFI